MEHECDTLPQWLGGSPPRGGGARGAGKPPPAPAPPPPRAAGAAARTGFLTLFTEEEIGTPSPAARRAAPLISPLGRFGSAQDRMEFVRQRIRQLGFDSFSYTATRTSSHHKTMFVLTSYESQTWLTRYFRERYFELDPRVALASPTGMPFLWNI